MKEKKALVYPKSGAAGEPSVLRESAVLEGDRVVTVRDAKAHLSALLEWVASGHALTITSDGKPKARLVAVGEGGTRSVFRGMGDFLLKQPVHRGRSAEDIVREERDSRP